MRLSICLVIVLAALSVASAQPKVPTLAGVRASLLVAAAGQGAPELPVTLRPNEATGRQVYLTVDFAEARDTSMRAAAAPGLAGFAAIRLFDTQGPEWQRHYELGVAAASMAYAADDHAGADRCLRALGAGLLVGAAKEISDGYFDWRDLEGTACGAAVTALFQAVMPRWEW